MMTEPQNELAATMAQHALRKLDDSGWEDLTAEFFEHCRVRKAFPGAFHLVQIQARGWLGRETLDIWHGKKVLSLRNDGDGWEIVSIDPGEWESVF